MTIPIDDCGGRYRFDVESADRVCAFFPRYCSHGKGAFAGKPFEPLDYQLQLILRPIFGWVQNTPEGLRRFRKSYIQIPKKNGKALALDTPIPTPDGWTTMGELREGDTVFDDTGKPTRVAWASPVMEGRDCYRVEFSDGSSIVADADHQWLTRTLSAEGVANVVTTRVIAETLLRGDGARNHSIDVHGPLQAPEADLPVHPYAFGVWLGDGDSSAAAVTGHRDDSAILREMEDAGVRIGRVRYRDGRHPDVFTASRIEGMQQRLRALGVLGNKHIPTVYLRASEAQRLALLQGIMDTDGHCTRRGQCELVTVSPALRDGYLELIRTLGLKPTLVTDRARLDGRDCGERHRIQFWAFADRPVFRLPRKRSRQKPAPARRARSESLQVVSCDLVESVPVRCITVESPSSLYLAGRSMVVTHNTQLIAGLALYMLLCDREPGAEVYVAAADREQARVLFNAAKSMVEANPQLAKRCIVTRNKIEKWGDPDSFFQVLSAEAATKHGPNIHCLIVDELHVQHDRDLLETLTRGIIARRQPLILEITTAGDDDESICFEEYDYARRVLSGTIEDERHLPVIFEATAKDDWLDPAVWQKVNPGLGITISREQFEGFAVEAKNEPRKRNDFMRYHLNRWVNQAESWIPVDWWDACDEPIPSDEVLRQYQCANGTDMAQKIDLAANVTLFRLPLAEHEPAVSPVEIVTEDDETGTIVKRSVDLNYRLVILPTFWLPKDTLKARVDQDQVRYDIYEAEGQLEVTEGAIIDEQAIVRHVMDKGAKSGMVYRFPMLRQGQFGYDPAFATSVALQLAALGLTTVEVLQNYKHLCEACQVFEALVKARRVIHGGHRLLRWNVENVAVKTDDAGRIRPVKPKKATRRIDGVVATLIALSRLIAMPPLPARVRRAPKVWTPDGFVPAGGSDGAESRDGARV